VSYREFAPRRAPADVVACVWERTAQPGTAGDRAAAVLPDGCVDLVWNGERLLVAGPDTRPAPTPRRPGQAFAGLRFPPGLAGPALGLPASELRDLRVELADLWGGAAAPLADRLAAADGAARLRLLEDAVLARLPRMRRPDPLVLAAARALGRPGTRVGSLARVLGASDRQLRRRFAEDVGYGPKVLDRVLRFQRFLGRRAAADGDGLARLAAELGFADQAHLTRECRALAGLTPGQLLASPQQQLRPASPHQDSTPSRKATAAIASAASGSAHHQPASAFSARPTSSASAR
jgi:AraC-like DNA-binding protein